MNIDPDVLNDTLGNLMMQMIAQASVTKQLQARIDALEAEKKKAETNAAVTD